MERGSGCPRKQDMLILTQIRYVGSPYTSVQRFRISSTYTSIVVKITDSSSSEMWALFSVTKGQWALEI